MPDEQNESLREALARWLGGRNRIQTSNFLAQALRRSFCRASGTLVLGDLPEGSACLLALF